MLQYQCPHCQAVFQVDASMSGQQMACPTCYGLVQVAEQPVSVQAVASELPATPDQASESVLQPLACPMCGGMFQADASMAGQQVACPHCQAHVTMPAFEPASEPPPPDGIPGELFVVTNDGKPNVEPVLEMELPVVSTANDADATAALPKVDTKADALPDSEKKPVGTGTDRSTMLGRDPTPNAAPPNAATPGVIVTAQTDQGLLVHDAPKTVIHNGEVIQLRRLTPEEKTRRRRRKNLIMGAVSFGILMAYLVYAGIFDDFFSW